MKLKSIFPALFALVLPQGITRRMLYAQGLQPMALGAFQRYGTPVRGWRKIQSKAKHDEIQRRKRRNAK